MKRPATLLIFAITLTLAPRAWADLGPIDGEVVFGPRIGATATRADGLGYTQFSTQGTGFDMAAGAALGYRGSRLPNEIGTGIETGVYFVRRGIDGLDYDAGYQRSWGTLEVPLLFTIHSPVISVARPKLALGTYFNVPVGEAPEEINPQLLGLQANVGLEFATALGLWTLDFAYQRSVTPYSSSEGEDSRYHGFNFMAGVLF